MATTAGESDKAALRRASRDVRKAVAARLGARAGTLLAAAFPEALASPGAVAAGFWPIGDEIDPRPLMERLAGLGCGLCLPVVVAKGAPLLFRRWRAGDPLVGGPYHTSQPAETAEAVEPGLVLVPLLAFDGGGARLGYGGGYYDRTLEGLRARRGVVAVGLAYSAQRVEKVPVEIEDQRLDWIVTEAGATRVNG